LTPVTLDSTTDHDDARAFILASESSLESMTIVSNNNTHVGPPTGVIDGTGATGVLGVGETDAPFSTPGGCAAATGPGAAGSGAGGCADPAPLGALTAEAFCAGDGGAPGVTGGAAEGAGNSETLCPVFAAPDVPGDDGNPGAAGFCCGIAGNCDGF
jgi:hypothetical protein